MKPWHPRVEPTKKEQFVLKRLKRTRKLFAFLRMHRHELFDEAFQEELANMYRRTGAGDDPVPPALLCMAVIVQGYLGVSDAEAVELSVLDLRWQMVLDNMGSEEPAFSRVWNDVGSRSEPDSGGIVAAQELHGLGEPAAQLHPS
jgi:hypothetical protein